MLKHYTLIIVIDLHNVFNGVFQNQFLILIKIINYNGIFFQYKNNHRRIFISMSIVKNRYQISHSTLSVSLTQ